MIRGSTGSEKNGLYYFCWLRNSNTLCQDKQWTETWQNHIQQGALIRFFYPQSSEHGEFTISLRVSGFLLLLYFSLLFLRFISYRNKKKPWCGWPPFSESSKITFEKRFRQSLPLWFPYLVAMYHRNGVRWSTINK